MNRKDAIFHPMKVLYFQDHLNYISNYPKPIPKRNEALIRVKFAGICNTDLEITKGYFNFKGILGHEFVGIIEKSLDKDIIGKRVVGDINIGCGRCSYCRNKLKNHCPKRKVLGIFKRDGAFAEYLTLPLGNIHPLPANISDEEAVFMEPLAAVFEILEQVKITPEQKIMVIGDGKLGQLIARVLSLYNDNLLVIGKSKEKLSLLEKINLKTMTLRDMKKIETSLEADIIVECTGNSEGMLIACNLVKPKGTIILKSTYHYQAKVNFSEIVIKEINIIGSRCGPFNKVIKALSEKKVNPLPLISKIFSIEEGLDAFEYAQKRDILKVLLRF